LRLFKKIEIFQFINSRSLIVKQIFKMLNIRILNLISRKPLIVGFRSNAISSLSNRFYLFSKSTEASKYNPPVLPNTQLSRQIFTSKLLLSDEPTKAEEKKPTDGEKKLIDMLRKRFPKAKQIEVMDISGGCGSMYAIYVETIEFKNIRTVKQHQLINDVLKAEIKNNMHGLRIQTAVPE